MGEKIKCYMGLDLSTSNIGISLFDENSNLIEVRHLKLKVDRDTIPQFRYIFKVNMFETYMYKYKKEIEDSGYILEQIAIEEPLPNGPNINTTIMLAQFNMLCSYKLYEIFDIYVIPISVHESRKNFFPEYIKKKKKKNKKTNKIELQETLSFPKNVDKKQLVFEKVNELYPTIEWVRKKSGKDKGSIHKDSYDMADSVVVGLTLLNLYKD